MKTLVLKEFLRLAIFIAIVLFTLTHIIGLLPAGFVLYVLMLLGIMGLYT